MPPLGPGGDPIGPGGRFPGEQIPRSEIDRVRDTIFADIFTIMPGIIITGVEMTQSTQFFNLDNLSSGAAADNSVPLVANKPLVLRVYVEIRSGYVRCHHGMGVCCGAPTSTIHLTSASPQLCAAAIVPSRSGSLTRRPHRLPPSESIPMAR